MHAGLLASIHACTYAVIHAHARAYIALREACDIPNVGFRAKRCVLPNKECYKRLDFGLNLWVLEGSCPRLFEILDDIGEHGRLSEVDGQLRRLA